MEGNTSFNTSYETAIDILLNLPINSSCEEHFKLRKIKMEEMNISYNHFYYTDEPVIWKSLNQVAYIKIVAYALIIIGGLLGNLSVIFTVALVKSMRNTVNFYIANLAFADAMICIMCMLPHVLSVFTGGIFVLGEFMCKFNSFTQMACLSSSVLTLCAISCDRFVAVIRPLRYRTEEKNTSVVIAIIWIISLGVSIPFLIVKDYYIIEWINFTEPTCSELWPNVYYYDESTDECSSDQPLRKIYYVLVTMTLFFVPCLILLIAYSNVLFKLWRARVPGEQTEANVNAHSRSRKRVLKMTFAVLVAFFVCWTPIQGIILFSAFAEEPDLKKNYLPFSYAEIKWFSYYIAFANSFVNPFIYVIFNKSFRDGFILFLQCDCRRDLSRSQGSNIFLRSLRSMSTTFTSLRSTTPPVFFKRKSRDCTNEEMVMKPTYV